MNVINSDVSALMFSYGLEEPEGILRVMQEMCGLLIENRYYLCD